MSIAREKFYYFCVIKTWFHSLIDAHITEKERHSSGMNFIFLCLKQTYTLYTTSSGGDEKSLNKSDSDKISASFWFIVWRRHKSMSKVNWIKEMNHADTHSKYSSNFLLVRIHSCFSFILRALHTHTKTFFYFYSFLEANKRQQKAEQSTKRKRRRRKFLYCVLLWKFLFHNCPFSLLSSSFLLFHVPKRDSMAQRIKKFIF